MAFCDSRLDRLASALSPSLPLSLYVFFFFEWMLAVAGLLKADAEVCFFSLEDVALLLMLFYLPSNEETCAPVRRVALSLPAEPLPFQSSEPAEPAFGRGRHFFLSFKGCPYRTVQSLEVENFFLFWSLKKSGWLFFLRDGSSFFPLEVGAGWAAFFFLTLCERPTNTCAVAEYCSSFNTSSFRFFFSQRRQSGGGPPLRRSIERGSPFGACSKRHVDFSFPLFDALIAGRALLFFFLWAKGAGSFFS